MVNKTFILTYRVGNRPATSSKLLIGVDGWLISLAMSSRRPNVHN